MAGGDNVEIYDDVKIRLFKYFTSFLRDKIEMKYKQDEVGMGGRGGACCPRFGREQFVAKIK